MRRTAKLSWLFLAVIILLPLTIGGCGGGSAGSTAPSSNPSSGTTQLTFIQPGPFPPLQHTWKLMTITPSGGTLTDASALGATIEFSATSNASTSYTYTLPAAYTNNTTGVTYAACTETGSWSFNGSNNPPYRGTLTSTVTASPVSGSLCDPVGKVFTHTFAINGNLSNTTLTMTNSKGDVATYSLQLPPLTTITPLSTRLLGTWKLMTATPSGGTLTDVSAWGFTVRFGASAMTSTLPAAYTNSTTGVSYAACTETSSWTLNGNTLTTTVTASSPSGSLCDPVGKVFTDTVAINGNTLTRTDSTGAVTTFSLQPTALPGTSLSSSLLGTWKYMTTTPSGGTLTDVSALGFTVRFDASTMTSTLPAAYTNSTTGATLAACTETSSWTLNGNTLTRTVTASPVSGSLCNPVGAVITEAVAINGNTLTLTDSKKNVGTYSLQPTANTATPSTGATTAGTSWGLVNIAGLTIPSLNVVRNLNSQWIIAGFKNLLTLNNGVLNNTITIPTTGWIYGAAYGNGIYVGVGSSNTIITSPDATNWTARVSAFQGAWAHIDSVVFGNGKFVAVSSSTFLQNSPTELIQTSTDGITWASVDMTANTEAAYSPAIGSVTFGNGQFVAVGSAPGTNDAGIYTSNDGIAWVKKNTGLPVGNALSLKSVRFAGGIYVAVGVSGLVLTSPDGATWTKRTAVTPNVLRDVAYGNGKYVAVGDTGTMIESSDGGITWTALPALTTQWLNGIDFANNQFVVAGDYVLITSP